MTTDDGLLPVEHLALAAVTTATTVYADATMGTLPGIATLLFGLTVWTALVALATGPVYKP